MKARLLELPRVPTCENACPRWSAFRIWGVGAIEEQSIARDSIKRRRLDPFAAVGAEMEPGIIRNAEKNVRSLHDLDHPGISLTASTSARARISRASVVVNGAGRPSLIFAAACASRAGSTSQSAVTRTSDQLAKVSNGDAVVPAVVPVNGLAGAIAARFEHVANGQNLAVLLLQERLQVDAMTVRADPDESERDPFRGGILPEKPGRNGLRGDSGRDDTGKTRSQEAAPCGVAVKVHGWFCLGEQFLHLPEVSRDGDQRIFLGFVLERDPALVTAVAQELR